MGLTVTVSPLHAVSLELLLILCIALLNINLRTLALGYHYVVLEILNIENSITWKIVWLPLEKICVVCLQLPNDLPVLV